MKRSRFLAVGLLLLAAVALMLRLPGLEERPLHTDESVHALKFGGLWETGEYRYDPHEYHGPSLYYLTWPLVWASGAERFADVQARTLRLLPVLWGVGLILLLPWIKDGQGRGSLIWAGLLTAVSPAMVFYSRYYIHEMGLVFFMFMAMAAGWRHLQTGRMVWALVCGAGVGMVVTTKETFVLQFTAAGIGAGLSAGWNLWMHRGRDRGGMMLRWQPLAAACAVAGGLWLLLFTSFFTNAAGPLDSIRTYQPWFERAEGASPHVHRWSFYLELLAYQRTGRGPTWSEGLILGLGLMGLVVSFTTRSAGGPGGGSEKGSGGWLRFVSFYTVLLTLIYSVIPYKTPWCLLGFWHGWILLAGVGASALVRAAGRWRWGGMVAGLCLLLGTGQLAVQAHRSVTAYADNPRNPYVYAHTLNSLLTLVERVEALGQVSPEGSRLLIKVMARGGDYWPLPWYLRGFERVGWWGEVAEDAWAPVVVASPGYGPQLEAVLGGTHQMAGYYGLRPGVFLQLYVERGLWELYLEKLDAEAESEAGQAVKK